MERVGRVPQLLKPRSLGMNPHPFRHRRRIECFKIHPTGNEVMYPQRIPYGFQPAWSDLVIGIHKYEGIA